MLLKIFVAVTAVDYDRQEGHQNALQAFLLLFTHLC